MSVYLLPVQEDLKEQTFIKGLKPDIQAEMSREHLAGLRAIMDLASNAEN